MTLHDVRRFSNHWRRNPPLRSLVRWCAEALGVKIPDPAPAQQRYMTAEEADRIAAAFGNADALRRQNVR